MVDLRRLMGLSSCLESNDNNEGDEDGCLLGDIVALPLSTFIDGDSKTLALTALPRDRGDSIMLHRLPFFVLGVLGALLVSGVAVSCIVNLSLALS